MWCDIASCLYLHGACLRHFSALYWLLPARRLCLDRMLCYGSWSHESLSSPGAACMW